MTVLARRVISPSVWLLVVTVMLLASTAPAQQPAAAPPEKPAVEATPPEKPAAGADEALALEQERIAEKYKHLEDVLLRMAELSASTDPRRAALLRKAVAQSKERLVGVQFERMSELLRKGQISRALENQEDLDKDLRALLELLMSENRSKQLESEKARIREYLKRLTQLIRQQKGIQGRTGGADDPKPLSGEQGRLADETGRLAKDVKRNEEDSSNAKAPGRGDTQDENADKNKDGKNKDAKGKDDKGKDDKGKDEGKQDGNKQEGNPSDKDAGKEGGKGQPQGQGQGESQGQGQQGGAPQPSQPPQPQPEQENPARKRLDAARQRMEEAKRDLEQAQREGALEKQEEALRELEQARADLEEILRQLREEEIERTLTALEARFQKMLAMQRTVYAGTQRLDKVPQDQRTHNQEIEAGRLSNDESLIVLEADKALALLREEGSAAAFPEAVSQMRTDMQQIVVRLARAEVGTITQGIEEDVIAALEEMIAALEKAIQDRDQNRQQPPPQQQQGQPGDQPLVDQLAELRMIRALQVRVNRRTDRYSKLLEGGQADKGEMLDALQRLAERQAQIHRVTRDLAVGKNQ